MTEAEWLVYNEPRTMLKFVRDEATDRRLRLFAVASCRRIWHLFNDTRSKEAIEIAERFADGQCSEEEVGPCIEAACDVSVSTETEIKEAMRRAADAAVWCASIYCSDATLYALINVGDAENVLSANEGETPGKRGGSLSDLLRDIFGNPFRPLTLDPAWLITKVNALAQAVYDDRAFDRLPVLAGALEEAGCDDADILAHCRGPGPHVRGCWVVDLLLGKE